ncbi:serine/threonine protein kinase [Polyangium aurulentum]|uniref:serine/threonine protein kinase n=1 Tax=Polyangium aurulentum TaxID=2567896 RepID=UPI00146D5BED|nr:serine/threonine-protein kinase [Polyangium aurulentum]UQA57897.1 serine/threonine protein kinase [Polyangium aurulentum]
MAETQKIAPGLVIAGRYRVVREIGRGAVGSVHLVQHLHTDEQFALKILHDPAAASPEKIARFRVEARAPARIDSDHVVRITDADVAPELGGAPFFVMEYLRGKDLGAELEACLRLHPREVVFYMRQAARALDKAHGLGIIHRDLKPENLFLTEREDGVPLIKLVDFGIAKVTGDAAAIAQIASKTQTGRIFGTPLFMSPEQATGRVSQIGPTTDVWALGLVAHKLLTGRDHFESSTIAELIAKIAYDPIQPPSKYGFDYGRTYDAWFLRCCHREPGQRFRSAGEAVTALAEALSVEEGDALVDAVLGLRRARALAYRATDPVLPSQEDEEEIAVTVASTLDPPVQQGAPAPAVAPPAPAPAPAPVLAATVVPFPQDKMTGSAGTMVRTADDGLSPRRAALRSGAIFVGAVAAALIVGLAFGLLVLRSSPAEPRAGEPSSSAPAVRPPVSATTPVVRPSKSAATSGVAPRPSASASAAAPSPSASAPASGSSGTRGGTTKVRDPLRGRH